MFQESEIISLILVSVLIGYLALNRARFRRIPSYKLLSLAFVFLIAAWVFTVLEAALLPDILNLAEHLAYMAGAISMAAWCRQVFGPDRQSSG